MSNTTATIIMMICAVVMALAATYVLTAKVR